MDEPQGDQSRVIVRVTPDAEAGEVAASVGGQVVHDLAALDAVVVDLSGSPQAAASVVATLGERADVVEVEADVPARVAERVPDDELFGPAAEFHYPGQWGLWRIEGDQLHEAVTTSSVTTHDVEGRGMRQLISLPQDVADWVPAVVEISTHSSVSSSTSADMRAQNMDQVEPLDFHDCPSSAPPNDVIRVLIVEDHVVVADGIAMMLSFEPDIEVVEAVTSGEAALTAVERDQPDVALMDIRLEGMDGLAAMAEIVAKGWPTHMVALTMCTDHHTVARAVAAGVSGYLPKNVRRDELVQAVRAVAAGKGFLHPDVTRPFLKRVGRFGEHAGLKPLSQREKDVLGRVAAGESSPQIAATLGIGEETVKSHLSRIYDKLEANDRAHAVVIALRHGLIR